MLSTDEAVACWLDFTELKHPSHNLHVSSLQQWNTPIFGAVQGSSNLYERPRSAEETAARDVSGEDAVLPA
jgi:hypothetical protein